MRRKVRLDTKGIAQLAKGAPVRKVVESKVDEVARGVKAMGITVGGFHGGGQIELPVEAKVVTTDRAHGLVTIAHPAGKAVQAKHGALTKAAAQAGLQVKDKKS